MKNTAVWVVVLAVVLLGIFFFINKESEAPAPEENTEGVSNQMPAPGFENVPEMVVSGGVKEFTVTGTNFDFSPSTIRVKEGDKVKMTFVNSQGFHDFVIDEYGVATKQSSSPATEVIEFTANKKGSFEYYCSVGTHRALGMKGTLIVE